MRSINVSGRSVNIVTGYKNLGELSEKLEKFSYRVLKDDCLDLPKKTFMKRMVQLTREQEKVYRQMKELALAELNGKMVYNSKCYNSNDEATSNHLWSLCF